ncbi:MAG: carbon storage regulator CsrA [bacterium]
MLVLSRKLNESIMVGDDVEIVVVSIKGDQVKLGINAPRHIPVHRKEIYEEIQAENIAAAKADKSFIDDVLSLFKKERDTKREKPKKSEKSGE